jgi:predicted RNA-binding Zn ribbon-like protein
VLFSHDTERSLACVVDLVNSAPTRYDDTEQLADVAALEKFVVTHEVSDVTGLTGDDVVQVRRLRPALAAVFDAGHDRSAAEAVNALVAGASVRPRLTDHDGYAWHLHYVGPDSALSEHLAVDCGMALAQVVAAGERERLRRCDAPTCDRVLVDLSRNRSKRYCDARTCGNRLHVAAYRERRRTTDA